MAGTEPNISHVLLGKEATLTMAHVTAVVRLALGPKPNCIACGVDTLSSSSKVHLTWLWLPIFEGTPLGWLQRETKVQPHMFESSPLLRHPCGEELTQMDQTQLYYF